MSAAEPPIETANGSFYQNYKKETREFLDFVRKVGDDGIASGKLQPADLAAVERGLSLLESQGKDLFPLLAKIIDEKNPTFWDECVVEHMWGIFSAVFLIAQHSGITRSAKAFATAEQSVLARSAKAAKDASRAASQKDALRELLGDRDLSQPWKLAESIFRTPDELAKLNLATKKRGVATFSESTAARLLKEMRDSKA